MSRFYREKISISCQHLINVISNEVEESRGATQS
jgi:hypothetical protein